MHLTQEYCSGVVVLITVHGFITTYHFAFSTSSFAAGTEEEAAIAEITASDWYIPTEDLTFHDEIGHGAFGTIVLASLINYSASETPAVSVAVKGPRGELNMLLSYIVTCCICTPYEVTRDISYFSLVGVKEIDEKWCSLQHLFFFHQKHDLSGADLTAALSVGV